MSSWVGEKLERCIQSMETGVPEVSYAGALPTRRRRGRTPFAFRQWALNTSLPNGSIPAVPA